MNKLPRIAAVPVATLSILIGSCAYSSDSYPEKGIVVTKDTEEVDGDCTFSYQNVCMAYDQETEYSVTVADCKKAANGVIELASEEYLQRHQTNPSDYPIKSAESIKLEDDSERFCSAKIVVTEEIFTRTEVGSLFINS